MAGAIGHMLQMMAQAFGRGVRRTDDMVTVWIPDARLPPPSILLERDMLIAHPASKPQYLAAIPDRFRKRFGDPGVAEFGVRVATARMGRRR